MRGTPHIRIGLDTAHYSESGMDTAHNTTHYSKSGMNGEYRTRNCVQFTLGWYTVQNSKTEGGYTAQNQSRLLGGWLGGWVVQ